MRTQHLLLIAALAVTPALAQSPKAEGFKQLTGPQIRNKFTGKIFSDDVHFTYHYAPSGAIEGIKMGKKVADKWEVTKDRLCITDSFDENCYLIWVKGSSAKLTVNGSFVLFEGSLK